MASKNETQITQELGDKIRLAREKANLTQEELARKSGISSNYFAKIERGEINTTVLKLYKIIKALNVEASVIFPS